jgi:beta-lactamase superfamily II metal-dependent hydrolase
MQNRKANRRSAEWAVLAVVLLLGFALLVGYGDMLFPKREPVFSGSCVRVHFLDVGQGASTLIQSGETGILIDAGEREYADRVIAYLKTGGVKKLSLAVATHPHSDHIGALPEVLRAIPTDALLVPALTAENMPASYAYEALLNTVRDRQIRLAAAKPGDAYTLDHVTLQILAPLEQSLNLNDMSVVCRVSAFETVFLLPADAEIAAQETLLQSGAALGCNVLQVPHHGSSGALCKAFLKAAKPGYAVISCGAGNDYGHPHPAVLAALQDRRCKILRTDLQSDVVFSCYAEGFSVNTAEEGENRNEIRP